MTAPAQAELGTAAGQALAEPPARRKYIPRTHTDWTAKQDRYLAENFGYLPIKQIAKKLGKTEVAIRRRADMERLQHPLDTGEYLGVSQVADALGISYETAKKLMMLREFPATTLYSQNLARLAVRYADLERFIMDRHNWYALDISKIQHPRLSLIAHNMAEVAQQIWMTTAEAADFLSMSGAGVMYYVRTGDLKAKRYNHRLYFLIADLKRFDKSLQEAGTYLNAGQFHVLDAEKVTEIRLMRAGGMTYQGIADHFGVALETVRSAALGRTWRHVPFPLGTKHIKNDRKERGKRLTQAQVLQIIELLWNTRQRVVSIAEQFGISESSVYAIAAGKTWAWLPRPAGKPRTAGRIKGERVPNSKLTEDEVREIRRQMANGATGTALGRRYGVASSSIYAIRDRRTWKHVD